MDTLIGKTLSRYRIVEQIGAGGMGVVYRAHDEVLRREVAVKVLPAAANADPGRLRRFEQEARAAGALNHPNILAIYDFGEHEGSPYVVTELLEGRTLREQMGGRALPVRKALEYGAQMARGLSAAHEKGIVHRDLKPENVFISADGRVKILDFGIAKLMRPAGVEDGRAETAASIQTEAGAILGTAGYMSPEQVRGEPVDHRSDLFAFGAVLYEVLAGRAPFRGATFLETASAILRDDPQGLAEAREIPRNLDRIVRRCLEKELGDRFQTAADLAFCLEGVLVDLVYAERRSDASPGKPSPALADRTVSIAVLPFEDLSPSRDSGYFSSGLTEEITASLSKLQSLQVMSRTSAAQLNAAGGHAVSSARDLRVDFVLVGSVRKAENALRITAQLIDTAADRHVWVETYHGTMDDVFDIQEQVASKIAGALSLTLSPMEKAALSVRSTTESGAFDLTLRGRHHLRAGTRQDLETAVELFGKAITSDSRYAAAHAGLAEAYATLYEFYDPKDEWLRLAVEAASKAVLYDATLPEAYASLGLAHFNRGQMEDAIAACERAIELRPNDFIGHWMIGRILYATGRHREAVEQMQTVIRINPEYYPAYFMLRMLYTSLGESTYRDTILPRVIQEIFPRYLSHSPQDARARNSYGTELSHAGRVAEGRAEIEKALAQAPGDPLILYATACYYATFGEKGEALRLLRKAVDAGFRNARYMKQDPDLEPLRQEPEYRRIVGEE